MRVLVTGAFGNIGQCAVSELLLQGHAVRTFDLANATNRRAARTFGGTIDPIWGDLRKRDDLIEAMHGIEAVIHTAFIIPPSSEREPEQARSINVGGTRNLLDVMQKQEVPPRIVYTSSISLFGPRGTGDVPPLRAQDPVVVSDTYTSHKIETEKMMTSSGLEWAILRLGAILPLLLPRKIDPLMFEIPDAQRMETCHPQDVGLALANAVSCKEAFGRILLIGGGSSCRITSRQLRERLDRLLGTPNLPESAFGTRPFYTDFLDTEESQRILRYQRYDFEDYLRDLRANVPWPQRLVTRLLSPWIRRKLLEQSPYWRPT